MLTKEQVAQIKEANWLTVHAKVDETGNCVAYLDGAIVVRKYGNKAEIPIEMPIDGGWIEQYNTNFGKIALNGVCVFDSEYITALQAIIKVGDIVRAQFIIGDANQYMKDAGFIQNTCNLRIQRGNKVITVHVGRECVPAHFAYQMVRPL